MPDILHRVGIRAPANNVYNALTTLSGLSGWWTSDTRGDATAGGIIQFRFGDSRTDIKVLELKRGELVAWEVLDAHPDWIGTKIRFDLKEENGVTFVLFKHEAWKQPTDFMHHCTTKWGVFLVSLKALLEKGEGLPFPNDVQIVSKAA